MVLEEDSMKKFMSFLILGAVLVTLVACSGKEADSGDMVSVFWENEQLFLQAADSGDYSAIERLRGVQDVYVNEKYIDVQGGGSGFGANTYYYGIFYSEDDNLCAIGLAGPREELVEKGDGYLYKEEDGDNRYYVEPLGHHYYFYEAYF